MNGWPESFACRSHAHCNACRTDAAWRANVGAPDECPEGYTADKIPSRGLGDTVAKITKAVGIKPCGGCKKRQGKLNRLVPYNVGV